LAIDERPLTEDAIVDQTMRLRDFLKFEFFFPSSRDFEVQVRSEIERFGAVDQSTGIVVIDLDAMRPAKSPIVLRPFLEAYFVVAETLGVLANDPVTEDELKELCLRMGNQLLAEGIVETAEAVSTTLFASGIKAAANRGLLSGTRAERSAYAEALEEALAVLNLIDSDEDLIEAEANG
jgi:glycerol-3-phosphate O-acyltransferase